MKFHDEPVANYLMNKIKLPKHNINIKFIRKKFF